MNRLSLAAQRALVDCARAAIADAIGAAAVDRRDDADGLERAGAAFVTVRVRDDLRGCIGHIEAQLPLRDVVARCAVSAATSDPRFPAIAASEWELLALEISVLGPVEAVTDLSQIEIGVHGLMIEMGEHHGLLLPQVATEWKWDRTEFVARVCGKAGLPKDAWQHGARLFRFEADVFGD